MCSQLIDAYDDNVMCFSIQDILNYCLCWAWTIKNQGRVLGKFR